MRTYKTETLKVTDREPTQDFERRDTTLLDITKTLYVSGTGPAVTVTAEIPGIYAHFLRFARIVR